MKKEEMQIVQMVPANGWFAAFEREGGGLRMEPLVCWATVEYRDEVTQEPCQSINGFYAAGDEVCNAVEAISFQYYVPEDEVEEVVSSYRLQKDLERAQEATVKE